MSEEVDKWREFNSEFTRLAREEERIEQAAPKDRLLYAMVDYSDHPEILHEKGKPEQGIFCLLKAPESGLWVMKQYFHDLLEETARAYAEGATQDKAERQVSKLLIAEYARRFDPSFPQRVIANIAKAYQVIAFAPN